MDHLSGIQGHSLGQSQEGGIWCKEFSLQVIKCWIQYDLPWHFPVLLQGHSKAPWVICSGDPDMGQNRHCMFRGRQRPFLGSTFRNYRMLVRLEDILCCPGTDTYFKCRYLQLQLRRNCIRRHDYLALMDKTALLHAQIGIYHLPKKSSWTTYYYSAWNYFRSIILAFCHIQPESADEPDRADKPGRTAPVDDEEPATTNPYVGGGSSSFALEDLQEYFLPENASSQGTSFRFNDYILQSEIGQLEDLVACDIPIHLLITKLPIKVLQKVAACHGIYTHSKQQLADIQNAICNHMCEDCHSYAAVFELADENKKKGAHLKAVKKYQEKHGDAYKTAHLESAKKHQEKQGDAYKTAHMESVKKHQEKQGDAYKTAHLESVKKHQEKQGDAYKTAHLESVKKHQEKQGKNYKTANLDSVQRYQDKNQEKYRITHQAAASKYRASQ